MKKSKLQAKIRHTIDNALASEDTLYSPASKNFHVLKYKTIPMIENITESVIGITVQFQFISPSFIILFGFLFSC